jgi:hypothetical protein
MLIGISGRIGSGKDTVGSIIQYLTAKDIGSDCMKRIRAGLSIEGHHNSDFQIKKFAGKLKLIGSILSGIVADQFEDQEFKKLYMGVDWDMTYREFLQKLGTEAMRDGLHVNVWVNALFADYKCIGGKMIPVPKEDEYNPKYREYPNWIITDMRFPNEMEAVEQRKGITIRVHRDLHNGNAHISPIPHASETALDDAKFDYEIINDGTLEDLVEKVKEILIKENII